MQGWLQRHGWPYWATIVVILLVYAILLGLALGIIISIARLATELPQYASKADGLVSSLTAQLAGMGVGPEQLKQAASSLNLGKLAGLFAALLGSVAGLASNFVFLISLLLFLSVEAGGPATGSPRSGRSARRSTRRWVTSRGERGSTCS